MLTHERKIVFVVEEFVYKICLTYTTAAAYNDKFRTV